MSNDVETKQQPTEITGNTKVTLQIAGILAAVGVVFAAGMWCSDVASNLRYVSEAVADINTKIGTVSLNSQRITVLESKVERLERQVP